MRWLERAIRAELAQAMNDTEQTIAEGFAKMGIENACRHAFLCTGPNCCPREIGMASWEALKLACKVTGAPAMRTRADCLRVCAGGPWLVVYPEGVWYGNATVERVERIVREHVNGGKPIEEWVAKAHPLCR